ncbi:ABC transporter ATP-binding protein [Patescibacteria group bacterium]|nr:ABC transporter ATP-binding protein [Patescibacteria group bacterium]
MKEQDRDRILLEVRGITKRFGGLVALDNVDFKVQEGEVIGLIGPNGAGKSTLFNILAGNLKQDKGEIWFSGRESSKLRPFERCHLGISRSYQIPRPFLDFSVKQNVLLSLRFGRGENYPAGLDPDQKAIEILKVFRLENKKEELTRNLNAVERKRVELARALAANPRLLLLDEVLAGLNPAEIEGAIEWMKMFSSSLGITVIWVEHIIRPLLAVCTRLIVLHHGKKLKEGSPTEVVSDEKVIEAYLGRTAKAFQEIRSDNQTP